MTKNNIEPLIIGITGGIGAGKSTFATILKGRGEQVISTDELAKTIISTDSSIKKQIVTQFGDNSYIDGIYNTAYISNLVFNGQNAESNLLKLNQIVHPAVIESMILAIDNSRKSMSKMIFVESALIYELELEDGFDYIISVSANENTRISRISGRSGLSAEQINNRMKQQINQSEKNKTADFVVENSKNIDELHQSADFILSILNELSKQAEQTI